MRLSLSTCWNSKRHETGEAMLDEIAALGFDSVELGYALTFRQADGVRRRLREGAVRVSSIHAFCPNPVPGGHAGPEPFSICDPADFRGRRHGISAVLDSARFASEIGVRPMVLHAGRVPVFRAARRLDALVSDGVRAEKPLAYEKKLLRFQAKRERKAPKYFETLRASLEILLPELGKLGVLLCLENLPTADGCPDENEMSRLLREFEGAPLAYWHDAGHGQRRHELGLVHHAGLVKRMGPRIGGFHLHDVLPPLEDHMMPPGGLVDFRVFAPFAATDLPLVLEPRAARTAEEIVRARDYLLGLWKDA
jgi:sugar phosphate isomerase/epimerase